MSAKKVVTPVGFIEVLIDIDKQILSSRLAFVSSTVFLFTEDGHLSDSHAVRIGSMQTIVVKPGKYKIRAALGELHTDLISISVKPGQVERITFYFGKESQ